jgi:hypothetical protein
MHEIYPLGRPLSRKSFGKLLAHHSYGKFPFCFFYVYDEIELMVLQTLQHLVWILGLKPVTGGGLSSIGGQSSSSASGSAGGAASGTGSVAQPPSENNSVITTAVMADLPVLSNMVTRLFESSGKQEILGNTGEEPYNRMFNSSLAIIL